MRLRGRRVVPGQVQHAELAARLGPEPDGPAGHAEPQRALVLRERLVPVAAHPQHRREGQLADRPAGVVAGLPEVLAGRLRAGGGLVETPQVPLHHGEAGQHGGHRVAVPGLAQQRQRRAGSRRRGRGRPATAPRPRARAPRARPRSRRRARRRCRALRPLPTTSPARNASVASTARWRGGPRGTSTPSRHARTGPNTPNLTLDTSRRLADTPSRRAPGAREDHPAVPGRSSRPRPDTDDHGASAGGRIDHRQPRAK